MTDYYDPYDPYGLSYSQNGSDPHGVSYDHLRFDPREGAAPDPAGFHYGTGYTPPGGQDRIPGGDQQATSIRPLPQGPRTVPRILRTVGRVVTQSRNEPQCSDDHYHGQPMTANPDAITVLNG
jgi:hypothetical protein